MNVCNSWYIKNILVIQWTPLIRLTLEPAQSESYNQMNLIGEVGKKI